MSAELIILARGQKCRVAALRLRSQCLVEDFLAQRAQGLCAEHAKLVRLLDFAAQYGPPRNEEKCRQLTGHIFEFKTTRLRVAWFWDRVYLIICTHVWLKKSRKTPEGEIEHAELARAANFKAKSEGTITIIESSDEHGSARPH